MTFYTSSYGRTGPPRTIAVSLPYVECIADAPHYRPPAAAPDPAGGRAAPLRMTDQVIRRALDRDPGAATRLAKAADRIKLEATLRRIQERGWWSLGLHAAADESVTSVTLDSNFQIFFVPPDLPINQVRDLQRNFRPWIIGNGLRELDQGMSHDLSEICLTYFVQAQNMIQEFQKQLAGRTLMDASNKT
jgi:hypothetical protein